MTTAVQVELKTYAHQKIADHLKYEYERQINSKWQPHINLMVDAQAEALKRHQKVLNDVRKQIEKEEQAAFGLAMLALTIAAGPVLSWIGGTIQYNWFPKYASTSLKKRQLYVMSRDNQSAKRYDFLERDHNKVHAKVFGDLGAQVAGLGIDKALKVVAPKPNTAQNAIQLAASSGQTSFKANLENAMTQEAKLTSDAIMSLANSITENSNYGAECLQKLRRVEPRARDPKLTEKQLEPMAKDMIVRDIDAQRQKWANEWFYYGYDPGTTAGMAENIERELWGLWILNEQFKVKTKEVTEGLDNAGYYWKRTVAWVEGATFGERGVPEQVLHKLADFGVVEARTQLQKLRAITARGVREELEKARKLREQQEDEIAAETYRKAMEDAEAADDPARERAFLTRQRYASVKMVEQRRAQERAQEKQDPPPTSVGSAVDTQAEIAALESWAEKHPLMLSAGQLTGTKRNIGSIKNIYPQ